LKTKTINAAITKKVNGWLLSITDRQLAKDLEGNVVVTGGCIASMLLKEKVRDYDVYITDFDLTCRLARYYVGEFKNHNSKKGIVVEVGEDVRGEKRVSIKVQSAGIAEENINAQEDDAVDPEIAGEIEELYESAENEALEKKTEKMFLPVFLSTNAITLSHGVQVILRFYGSPGEIHANFDFVHCTNYWTRKEGVVLNQEALECLLTKELRYVGSRYPLASIFRCRKFVRRGFTVNAGQMLKMALQMNDMDLTDINTLEDQLTGVDVAYFSQVLDIVREKEQLDTAYLITVIDRMF